MSARKLLALLALISLTPLQIAAAAEPDCLDREPERVTRFGYEGALEGIKLCLGAGNDTSSKLAQSLGKFPKDETDVTARAKRIALLAGQLQGAADAWAAAAKDHAEQVLWLTVSKTIAQESALLAQPYETFSDDEIRRWKAQIFNPGTWQLADKNAGILPGVDLLHFDISKCAANPPVFDKCETYASRKDLLRVLNVGYLLGQYIVHDEFIASLNRAKFRDVQWTEYHEEALFQWPWELAINGNRMKKSSAELCKKDASGMQMGFCTVPSEQVIFLHPDVALQWVSGAENSSELHGAAYLELVGKYSWTWDAEGRISKPRGWSVIALYSNLSGESEVGYGLMYHGKRASTFALTVTDGHVGILASLSIADRLFTASDAARSKLAKALEAMQGQ